MTEAVVNSSADYKKKGYVSARDRDGFRRINDIAETFGVTIKSIKRGFQYKGGALWPEHEGMLLWWPKPSDWCTNKNTWMNEFGDADVEITEWHKDHNESVNHVEQVIAENCARPTFKVEKHSKHGYCYRFIGVYRLDVNRSRKGGKAIWVRQPNVDRIEVDGRRQTLQLANGMKAYQDYLAREAEIDKMMKDSDVGRIELSHLREENFRRMKNAA